MAEVIEAQLRLALLRAERGMGVSRNPHVRNAFLDVWQAVHPALRLLEEGRSLREIIDLGREQAGAGAVGGRAPAPVVVAPSVLLDPMPAILRGEQ